MRPELLRPPLPRRPSVSALTGLPFHSSPRSTTTSCRRDGVVGLNVLSAIVAASFGSNPGGHVDPLAFAEGDDRFFDIGPPARPTANALDLAHDADCVDCAHLDIEQPL